MLPCLRAGAEENLSRKAAKEGYILATDVADYLANKGIPFRQAHQIVAALVNYAIEQDKGLHQLKLEEYQRFSNTFICSRSTGCA